jgi:hypothetical protein
MKLTGVKSFCTKHYTAFDTGEGCLDCCLPAPSAKVDYWICSTVGPTLLADMKDDCLHRLRKLKQGADYQDVTLLMAADIYQEAVQNECGLLPISGSTHYIARHASFRGQTSSSVYSDYNFKSLCIPPGHLYATSFLLFAIQDFLNPPRMESILASIETNPNHAFLKCVKI